MKKKFQVLVLIGLCLLFPASRVSAAPLAVAVSIPPQKYFVEAVGGDDVSVTVMAGKGRDPHSYEPTAAQMAGISGTRLYIAIGVPFESQWLPKFTSLAPAMRVVFLQDRIERLKGRPDLALRDVGKRPDAAEDHDHGHAHADGGIRHGLEGDDPHIWLSPRIMADTIPVIVEALAGARPEKAARFKERGDNLVEETRRLDAAIAAMFARLPADKRVFLTFHQGWTYYAHNYGLREVSVELGGRDPNPKSMALLLDFAKKNAIKALIADPMTSGSALAAIAKNIDAEVLTATPLAEDWPASMLSFSAKLAAALGK